MPSIGGEEGSIRSLHSNPRPSDLTGPPISVHDHALENGDCEDVVAPELLPLSLRPMVSNKAASIATNGTNNPDYEVDWDDENDPENPRNWPLWYKGFTIFSVSWSTWCIVVYSTSYTTGLAQMQKDFHISSEPVVTLGVTSYCEFEIAIQRCDGLVDYATSARPCHRIYDPCTHLRNVRTPNCLYTQLVTFHHPHHSLRTRDFFARSRHCTFLWGPSRVCYDCHQPRYCQ